MMNKAIYELYLLMKAEELSSTGYCVLEHLSHIYKFWESDNSYSFDIYHSVDLEDRETIYCRDGGIYEGTAYEAILFAIKDDDV